MAVVKNFCHHMLISVFFQIIFGKKDHQNERYHRKRSLYLCHIANALLSNSTIVNEDMHFTLQNHNFTKPVLVVKPCGSLGNKITVYIHCVVSMSMCKPTKLAPNRNNIKSSWFLDKEVNEGIHFKIIFIVFLLSCVRSYTACINL